MKSIKPGRGPSFISGVGCIFAACFGIVWTILALNIGAGPVALFGVFFVLYGVFLAVYNFKNATQKNRYSMYDITDHSEENDPLNEKFGASDAEPSSSSAEDTRFCPYCGRAVEEDFRFCNHCGKELPE